jgi:mannose-1-phosphate guanylyltransferase
MMLVMPADHVISPPEQFRAAVEDAAALVEDDPERLVLFGVPPDYPATGFGYIERTESPIGERAAYAVASFREKPDRDTAQQYLDSGRFYWNCGIFVWRAQRIVDALAKHEPEIHEQLQRLASKVGADDWSAELEQVFPQMKSISIDYGVLERDDNICVLEAPFDWDDVGSWQALRRLLGADDDGNTIDGLYCGLETKNTIVRTSDDHLVATLGLEDCIVVHTPDVTLVARTDDENAVKQLVQLLKERGHDQFL